MKVIVIIPTYNEAENLRRLIPELMALPLDDFHVLVVDDNSQDGTGELVDELAQANNRIQVIHRPGKLGLGTAYVQGFQHALESGADIMVQMDADFSHPPQKLPEMIKALDANDVVIGSRYIKGGSVDVEWSLWRKALSAWGNFYARTILGLRTNDVTGGFRAYRRNVIEALPLALIKSNGYIYQVEMTYIIHRLGFTIGEIPIYFAEREWGASKMSFSIQLEAAIRTWMLPWVYRKLRKFNPDHSKKGQG
ncbi:MAG: polyprenol monophosphomannose synthase [Anaerolineae bacterium]|nr:polyprenol monophosphomannose synthase [Anaerolineae bacterium]